MTVDDKQEVSVSASSYLYMQINGLREQLCILRNVLSDLPTLPFRLRIMMFQNAPDQGRQTYHSLLSILAMVDRPALKQLYASNYDPLNLTLTVSDSNSTIYDS